MTTLTTGTRRCFAGLARYESFLNNDPYYYPQTKWNKLLQKQGLKCRPLSLREGTGFFFLPHNTEQEMLRTYLTVSVSPVHERHPEDEMAAMLRRHRVLIYPRHELEADPPPEEVVERLCAFVAFAADASELGEVLTALDVRRHAPIAHDLSWTLDQEPSQ